MAKAYVRIPFTRELEFPTVCPFTGQPNPGKTVFIWHPHWRFRIPIPIVEWFWLQSTARFRMPACVRVANIDRILRWMGWTMWLGVIIAVLALDVHQPKPKPAPPIENSETVRKHVWVWLIPIGFGLSTGLKFLRLLNLQAVTLVESDGMSVELCFAREDFARDFAAANHFVCHAEPFAERARRSTGVVV